MYLVFHPLLLSHKLTVVSIDRLVQQKDEFGNSKGVIKQVSCSFTVCVLTDKRNRPFVIDLESTNGTHVNGEAIPTSRYYELKASDGAFVRYCDFVRDSADRLSSDKIRNIQ